MMGDGPDLLEISYHRPVGGVSSLMLQIALNLFNRKALPVIRSKLDGDHSVADATSKFISIKMSEIKNNDRNH